ncbi:MAG: hypothetical protein K940chlam7_01549 [Chlamydiae bacterium]|nr:hypothetical protein [Chlamydiota bacterium]
MDIIALLVFSFTLLYLHLKLSARVRQCEQLLKEMKILSMCKSSPLSFPPITAEESIEKKNTSSQLTVKRSPKIVKSQVIEKKPPRKPFKIPNIIKENWIGVFGSIALVIGAVFFGLTAEIMQHAEVRVGVMIAVSCLFLGISQQLKSRADWAPLCGWLKSISGTVILFATLGAGGIEGLQFIHSPLHALYFLCFGISINILLAMTTPSQAVASLHVILSILSFCLAPQALILLPIGALVASVGLIAAYRSKWDLHLLLIVIAFAFQNTFWTISLSTQLLPWMHHLAIGSSVVVSLIAASVHYSKNYQSPKLEALPLAAHITNWVLLTWNIWLHAPFFKWTPFVLGGMAVAGFILARIAKRKGILWLYYTDTLLSQLVAMSAIASMTTFAVKPLDLSLMILFETIAFNFVCRFQKEDFLLRVGCFLQYICYLVVINHLLDTLSTTPVTDQFPIYLRMGIVTALSWGYHVTGSFKNFVVDDFRFVLFGQKDPKDPVSITTLLGTLFFMGIYFFGYNSLVVQAIVLSVAGLIALWRKLKEDHSWNLVFIISLIFVHLLSWVHLTVLLQKTSIPSIISRVDFMGLVLLDALLIFGNLLQFKLWKKNIHHFVIYALGIQISLLTYVFTKQVSILIPGLAYLGFSVLALEVGRLIPELFKYSDDVKQKIREGMSHIGLAFLIAFISRFVTVHLQIDPIWNGISLRWATEALGLLTIFYWMVFYPQKSDFSRFTRFCGSRLLEGCLGFITLCVFVEMPEVWRPFIWVVIAIGLFIGSLNYKWPKRLYVYSWMYLIASIVHVAFVTSNLTMPSLFAIEQHNTPAFMAVALQFCYAYLAYGRREDLVDKQNSSPTEGMIRFIPILYRQPSLTILLPIFLGVALLFAFNFEKAILTLLWVGLICVYLAVGLLVKSKRSIQIAMSALVFCSIRLIVFDLVQSDLATRALVFIGVGSLMLGVSVMYKKYKHRIEIHEGA